jgi:lysozyme family protein
MGRLLAVIAAVLLAVSAHGASIKPALEYTFGHEGGYQAMRGDSGNWTGGKVGVGALKGTKFGIAAASYPREDIKGLTLDRAAFLYERDFWNALRLNRVRNQIIANQVFDCAVNMGTGTSARILQRAINLTGWPRAPIAVDGRVGPSTIQRLNEIDQVQLYVHLIGLTHARYIQIVDANPRKMPFLDTWAYRVKNNVQRDVHEYETLRGHAATSGYALPR